jgi:hypothetical protein
VQLRDLNQKQQSLIDPHDLALLGTRTSAETEETLFAKADKLESKEHGIVMRWAKRNRLRVLHARTSSRVHDLPPGWPDFTLIRGPKVAFAEMKVHTRERPEQEQMRLELESQGADIKVTWSADETIRFFKGWLWEHFRWVPD